MKPSVEQPTMQQASRGKSVSIVRTAMPAVQSSRQHGVRQHVYRGLMTLMVLAILLAGLAAGMWFASFFLYASLRINPFHAGIWSWFDAVRVWYAGGLPKEGRRLTGSALFGLLLAFGMPGAAAHALWDHSGRGHLYGSARFASEAEIRSAGLL